MRSILIIYFMLLGLYVSSEPESHTMLLAEGQEPQSASIEQFEWIAGHWKGEAFGGKTEEIWTPPSAGSMMGAFKLSHGNEIAFYELYVLREYGETVILQIKHFHKDLKAWEKKEETVDFQLIKVTKDKAYFDQFTFERISENELHIYVVIDETETDAQEVKFVYHRAK